MNRTLLTLLCAAVAAPLFAPAAPAHAALAQQFPVGDLATERKNPLFHGGASNEQAGTTVAAVGDLNGDGLGDALIGAPLADANGRTDSGTVYVVFGRSGLTGHTNLGTLSAATGFRIDGAGAGDRLGTWVAPAGDVNGDGRRDIVVGAPLADPNARANAGAAYVITDTRRTTRLDLAQLGGAGYRIDGAVAGDRSGSWVAGGGDVDGDGRDDVVVTAPLADPAARTNAGAAYVVRGRGASAPVDLAALGDAGFGIHGGAAGDELGSAAIAGNVTGDSRADVLVGAPKADPGGRTDAGSAFVIAGRGGSAAVDLAAPDAGARIDGAAAGDALGAGVGMSPDVTGDGVAELLVGAPSADPRGRAGAGSLYLLPARGLPASTDLASSAPGARIDGADPGSAIGIAASGGGDMNGDGRSDLAVGDRGFDHPGRADAGAAHVLYGGSLAGAVDLAAQPAHGTRIAGASSSENSGTSLGWTADANGDGRDDLLVGAPRADFTRSNSGAGYVLLGFGAPSFDYPSNIDVTARVASGGPRATGVVRTGTVTYAITPALPAGMTLDESTGAIGGTPAELLDQPSVHKLTMTDLAGTDTVTVTIRVAPAAGACANARPAFGARADVFDGSLGGDLIRAGGGADRVDGRGGDDCLYGEGGDDTLSGGSGADQLDGGVDLDTLHGGEGNDTILGGDAADRLAGDAGDDALSGGPAGDVVDGGAGRDQVTGDAGDDQLSGGADADELHGGEGVDEITGGDGDDRAWADVENDFMDGGPGDDRLWAGPGRDSSHGGTGNDVLFGDADDDDLFGDAGDDELRGGEHQDELRGGDGNDAVFGEDGQDLVDGEAGDDVLVGGAGWDHITGDTGADWLIGEAGGDILDGGAGDDSLDGGDGDDTLIGGAGNDVLTGGAGNDTVKATAGRDRIDTGSGNDRITVKRGGNTVDAGAGNDTVDAFNGKRDTIVCGAGRDTAFVDRVDRVKGCEKRTYSKPAAESAKRKKSKKSSRWRR